MCAPKYGTHHEPHHARKTEIKQLISDCNLGIFLLIERGRERESNIYIYIKLQRRKLSDERKTERGR